MKITHDIHNHTLHSSCCYDPEATIAAFIDKAHALGHTTFGIANHMWDENVPGASHWYKGQTVKYVLEGKHAIPKNTYGMKVLFGAEVEYCGMSDTLAITAETAKKFDYMLIPHTHTHMRDFVFPWPAPMADFVASVEQRIRAAIPEFSDDSIARLMSALRPMDVHPHAAYDYSDEMASFCLDSLDSLLANPEFAKVAATVPTLIAHPVAPGEGGAFFVKCVEKIDRERYFEICKRLAAMQVGFDINIGAAFLVPENNYRDDPSVALMRLAKQAGIKFGCSTDSHTVAGLATIRRAEPVTEAIGITEQDLCDFIRQ